MIKNIIMLTLLALLIETCIGSATLIDLGDYILSTGDITAYDPVAFSNRNETTGIYSAIVGFGSGNSHVSIFLVESENNSSGLDPMNFTAEEGYKSVKKPYPGFLKTNSTTDDVSYVGMVNGKLKLLMVIGSYQRAIDVLKEITVISREDYQVMKADELIDTLN